MKYSTHRDRQTVFKRRRIVFASLFVLLLIGVGLFLYSATRADEEPQQPKAKDVIEELDEDAPTTLQGKYLFTGTIVPARGVEQYAQRADGSYDYHQPFSQLSTLNPDKYDAWVTDLECPVTDAQMTFRQQVETLVFNCRTEFVEPIAEYFEFINLANNHSGDMGREAFEQTQETLDKADLQIFGHYDPSVKDDVCEVVALPIRLSMPDDTEKPGRLPVAFCAWHYFTRSPEPGELEVMEEYVSIMPVFAFTHAGVEYAAEAQPPEVALAHSLIDAGAEFVINNNPHWVQNSEVYKDRLIVYSTGNFIFDQLDKETNRAANLDVELELTYDKNVAQWVELGESCLDRDDDCLQRAQQTSLEKVNLTYTFDVIASRNGYREITRRADDTTQREVEERLSWTQTLRELGQTNN